MPSSANERTLSKIVDARRALRDSGPLEDDLTYYPSILCQLSLPSRSQSGSEYRRQSGKYSISILTPEEFGIPYGCYPRGILAFIAREVVLNKNRSMDDPRLVTLGPSLGNFLGRITGSTNQTGGVRGTLTLFETQFRSLVNSTINYSERGKLGDEMLIRGGKYDFAKRYEERRVFQPHLLGPSGNTQPLSKSKISLYLGEDFYNDLIESAVPLQEPILRALWPSSLKIDIYTWLTYRANTRPGFELRLSWDNLFAQFGGDYAEGSRRIFKRNFKDALNVVREVYDPADRDCVQVTEDPKTQVITIKAKRPSVARPGEFVASRSTSYATAPVPKKKAKVIEGQNDLFEPIPEHNISKDWLKKFEFYLGRSLKQSEWAQVAALHTSGKPILAAVEAFEASLVPEPGN